MAARRVRSGYTGSMPGAGPASDGADAAPGAPADHEALRSTAGGAPKSGWCANPAWARPPSFPASITMGGLGGRGCATRKAGRLPARLHPAGQKHGYTTALYGHFGQGCVHNRIDFDLTSQEGISKFRSFMEEAADMVVGYGGSHFGRAWRRAGASGIIAEDVRPGADAGFPRIQGHLGPGRQDESGQDCRCLPLQREPAPRAIVQSGPARDAFQLSRRPGQLRRRRAALCRCGQVPPRGRGHDVPELTWSRTKKSTARADGRTCSSR